MQVTSILYLETEMRCSSCGRENNSSARFCAFCGAGLDGEPSLLQPGQLVEQGTYRIIRLLGRGGMGAVYLAANTKAFDRPCVVKEVIEYYDPTDPKARQRAIERFELEARMLAALKHPGIPDIYAYFTEHGRNYLVMEYIEGPNLAQDLTREKDGRTVAGHPQPLEDVIRYAVQICEVLSYLEQQQPPVIHNDIKPANIILDKNSGRAVLVDFGTAKTRYVVQRPGQPGRQQSSVYGTVGYAAPELYDGRAEPRSDVHALAATAYHLLTDDDPRDHPFQFPKMDTIPEAVRQVLVDALQVEVANRPSATQLSERLRGAVPSASPSPGSAALVSPTIHITPAQIDLGTASHRQLFTEQAAFEVRNSGQVPAHCQIEGNPPWLVLDPTRFACPPGRAQVVELVGRVDLLPTEGTRHAATLQVRVEGAGEQQVQVRVRTRGSRVGSFVMIGLATLILLGAIIWFVVQIWPWIP
jgi:serine/threonine protein kinase